MFSRKNTEVEDLVEKATSENLTSVDWDLVINLCDKVCRTDNGPKECANALIKRVVHKNPNVSKHALQVAGSCVQNCGLIFHREVASKTFLNPLLKHLSDKPTLEIVKNGILGFIELCAVAFRGQRELNLVEAEYQNLKRQGFVFPPPEDGKAAGGSSTGGGGSGAGGKSKVDAERQQEEEDELQLALALSISENEAKKKTTPAPTATKQMTSSTATPTVVAVSSSSSSSTRSASPRTDAPKIVRVRAEFDFIAQEPSELTFRKGDVIEVTDRSHQDWWRGRLGAATGAFPANYVKEMPEDNSLVTNGHSNLAVKPSGQPGIAELESSVDGNRIQALLDLLRDVDPRYHNLSDDATIQTLYTACVAMKPKLAQLVVETGQRKDGLLKLNDNYLQARASYDRQMQARLSTAPKFQHYQQPSPYQPLQKQPQQPIPQQYGPPPPVSAPPYPTEYGGYTPLSAPPATGPQYYSSPPPPQESYYPTQPLPLPQSQGVPPPPQQYQVPQQPQVRYATPPLPQYPQSQPPPAASTTYQQPVPLQQDYHAPLRQQQLLQSPQYHQEVPQQQYQEPLQFQQPPAPQQQQYYSSELPPLQQQQQYQQPIALPQPPQQPPQQFYVEQPLQQQQPPLQQQQPPLQQQQPPLQQQQYYAAPPQDQGNYFQPGLQPPPTQQQQQQQPHAGHVSPSLIDW